MSPGEIWMKQDWERGRKSICRALRIDHADPLAGYATLPFICISEDDQNWIAGAVGIYPAFSATQHWTTDDISDVVMWQPRSGELRLLGEAPSGNHLIMPSSPPSRMFVYATGYEFFRAWAEERAELFVRVRAAKDNPHKIMPTEPNDSGIPGALVIGDLDKIHWRETQARILVAAEGLDPSRLNRAVMRSANLPRVETDQRRAA